MCQSRDMPIKVGQIGQKYSFLRQATQHVDGHLIFSSTYIKPHKIHHSSKFYKNSMCQSRDMPLKVGQIGQK